MKIQDARIMAGCAGTSASLQRRLGVPLGDPAAWIKLDDRKIALVRDLEMHRVREFSQADEVTCPAEHAPPNGLSVDRETATAEAAVEILRDAKVEVVTTDRSLPFIYACHLQQAEIKVKYDEDYGVLDRRRKTEKEIEYLRVAQGHTETVIRMACEMIARADTDDQGQLIHDGKVLTSEFVKQFAAAEFLKLGCSMLHGAIVATAPQVADCHHSGSGPLFSGKPVIVDLFPRHDATRYWGDCTRTVVHGTVSDSVQRMHAAVVGAKKAAVDLLVAGNTADAVHKASDQVMLDHGYRISRGTLTDEPSMQCGTGHGIGLELHEPILLDHGGGELLLDEVFTVEPGLYGRTDGAVRIEDMLVVTKSEAISLNQLHEGLDWN
ncbi:Xaa-Pro aminopeptidase [Neorhodopirellula lusitana]|uniref:Xaa-Pro aminopeptidase n=1 Tax=Neorhodopirellula lusitana TaxID=445327 RepID=A0ABY1Q005_9BACT|nr:M24 family metallopeptidase [Neorhodopirellula lusitana]SMP51101.1 Xaa-Pro aminopeptidase [Neorhodopirellula lusitana]